VLIHVTANEGEAGTIGEGNAYVSILRCCASDVLSMTPGFTADATNWGMRIGWGVSLLYSGLAFIISFTLLSACYNCSVFTLCLHGCTLVRFLWVVNFIATSMP
jgi:hypothetical protein